MKYARASVLGWWAIALALGAVGCSSTAGGDLDARADAGPAGDARSDIASDQGGDVVATDVTGVDATGTDVTGRDGAGLDVQPGMDATGPDGAVTCGGAACAAGEVCCGATGRCYNPACLSCCMVVPPADGGGGCADNSGCAATEYCNALTCGGAGVCEPRPTVCTDIFSPVCGCDGTTYSNGCAAAGAGVRVATRGACTRPDSGTGLCATDMDCGGGQSCCVGTGRCYATGCLACCMPRPDAGVTGCADNTECAASEYCDATTCGARGTCVARPTICTRIFMPVCGCDGMTYGNACVAASMGARVASSGACTTAVDAGGVDAPGTPDAATTDCVDNSTCGRAQYCAGTGCGTPGTCAVRPTICTTLFSPVCGCDGMTYSNACTASAAGVRAASRGACVTALDAGVDPCATVRCAAGFACCPRTGMCYDTRCLACCMP